MNVMHARPNTHVHLPLRLSLTNTLMSTSMKTLYGLYLLLTCLLLVACGGEEATPATATAPSEAAAAPVSPLATASAPASATAAITPADTAAVSEPVGIAALVPSAVATDPVITSTDSTPGATPSFTPLEVKEDDGCEIESNLDLVGYPNLEETMGCATEEARFDPIAINEFGDAQPTDRFMLWFSHEDLIYVLLPDGSYDTYDDTWEEGKDPTFPCNPSGGIEDSPPLPRRGFGKLWCSNPELQEILGTVPREERLCQYSVLQRFESGRLLACFEDGSIRYFRILDNGTWDLEMQ